MLKRMSLIVFIFALAGCSSIVNNFLKEDSPEEIINKSMKAHQQVKSLEVQIDEDYEDFNERVVITADFKNNESNIRLNEDEMMMFMIGDEILTEYANGVVESFEENESAIKLSNRIDNLQNPLKLFTSFDGKIHDQFDMKKNEDQYVFTFNGSEEIKQQLGKTMVHYDLFGEDEVDEAKLDTLDIDISVLELSFSINSSSFLLSYVDQTLSYRFKDEKKDNKVNIVYKYGEFDDIEPIEQLSASGIDNENEEAISNDVDLIEEEMKQIEQEASAYMDALIQATVFQNEKGFIEKAPDSMSNEEKKSEAERQRDFFKEIYMENTKNNMAGAGVTDGEVVMLAEAFLKALSKTKYEVVNAQVQSADEVLVTISVEGINDKKVYTDTDEEMREIIQNEELNQEELIIKNIELLSRNYEKIDSLLDPIEIDVNVAIDNGQYLVMQQDQYLAGFVR